MIQTVDAQTIDARVVDAHVVAAMGVVPSDTAAVRTVRVGPYLDCRNVAQVRQQINHAIAGGPGIVRLDLRELDGIDAVGLGMLTAAHLRAEQSGCQLRLSRARASVRRVFAVTRLNRVLHVDRFTISA